MENKKSIKLSATANTIKTLLSILFPLITFPYISRILGTEVYGKYQFCTSIVNYFIYIAALGISTYAIRNGSAIRDDKNKLNDFCSEMFSINVFTTIISYALLVIFIILCSNNVDNNYMIYILSLTIIFNTIGKEWIFSIFEDYLFMSIRYIIFQIISLMLMFVFVKSVEDVYIYLFILQLATCGANLTNYFYAKKYVKVKFRFKLNLKKHLVPILILFFNNISVIIYTNSDITLLGIINGNYDVGLYSVSAKIYTILKQLVNGFIIVSLPRLSYYVENNKKEEFDLLSNKILNVILIFIIPIVCGLCFLSKDIILIISGNEYLEAHSSLKILSVSLLFSALASFYTSSVLISNKKEKEVLKCTLISAIVNIGLNIILLPKFGQNAAALTTVISEGIVTFLAIYYSKGIFNCKILIKDIIISIIGCIFIIIIIFSFRVYINNILLYLIIVTTISAIMYFIIHYIMKTEIVVEFFNSIISKLKKYKKDV